MPAAMPLNSITAPCWRSSMKPKYVRQESVGEQDKVDETPRHVLVDAAPSNGQKRISFGHITQWWLQEIMIWNIADELADGGVPSSTSVHTPMAPYKYRSNAERTMPSGIIWLAKRNTVHNRPPLHVAFSQFVVVTVWNCHLSSSK